MSTASYHAKARSGQFARLLHSAESARDDARVKGLAIPSDKMRPATHPPDAVLRAYSDLLSHVLAFQRGLSSLRDVNLDEAQDLADAMHNIAELLVDYGVHLDDEKYRALYLRPFDKRWAQDGFGLEQFLVSRLSRYSEDDCENPDT